jgi:hypothetical protein
MIQARRRGGRGIRPAVANLTCTPPRKFRTAKGELVAGKPGHENGRSENPQARSGVTQARIPRLFRKRRADRGHVEGAVKIASLVTSVTVWLSALS